jgi:hypothetical protein
MVDRAYHGPERDDTLHRVAGDAQTARMGEKTSWHGRASCIVGFEIYGPGPGRIEGGGSVPRAGGRGGEVR